MNFEIGDIVTLVNGREDKLFIIADIYEKTIYEKTSDRSNDKEYKLVLIYPTPAIPVEVYANENIMKFRAKRHSEYAQNILTNILNEGNNKWIEKFIDKKHAESNKNKKTKTSIKKVKNQDTVRYDLIDDIDECLDAMNDLKLLHETFGDEAYSQLRELVVKKLAKLVESEGEDG